jgi:hypothetical protein
MSDANTLNCTYRSDEATISLDHVVDEAGENGEYLLEWTDGVNEWAESYAAAPVALARFAVLVAGVTEGRLFAYEPPVFADAALRFVNVQLEPALVSSRFRLGQLVRVADRYVAQFLREERNPDGNLNGVALVRVTEHEDAELIGTELHVGVATLEAL